PRPASAAASPGSAPGSAEPPSRRAPTRSKRQHPADERPPRHWAGDAVDPQPEGGLEPAHRPVGPRPEDAVHAEAGGRVVREAAEPELLLNAADGVAPAPLADLDDQHRPRWRPDDPVRREPREALDLLHGRLRAGPEDPVDDQDVLRPRAK